MAWRLTREHSGMLLGVVLAGVLLVAWNAGLVGLRPTGAAARLSGYTGVRFSEPLAFVGLLAPAVPAPQPAPARVQSAPDPARVAGPPTLSAALIDTILDEYGSPAQGQGAVFYQMGLQYGIDPAFALGFYAYESHCGTRGVARFTHGIGNIRWTPGFASYEGYRAYLDFAAGIEDWFKLIRELYIDTWGLDTVAAIVPRYAPATDNNDPPTYIANVEALVATWRARASEVGR